MWTDGSGRALRDYEHPSVAVDVALLTIDDGRLAVLVHERSGGHASGRYALPGTFVRVEERLADAVLRALETKVGVRGRSPEQLRVFDDPDRDERGRVLSVAHVDVVPRAELDLRPGVVLAPVGDDGVRPPDGSALAYDHADVVAAAVARVRADYDAGPDPAGLAGPEFTLLDLQRLHEAVRGRPLVKDTFRRAVADRLVETGEHRRRTVGKPARLFRHAPPGRPRRSG